MFYIHGVKKKSFAFFKRHVVNKIKQILQAYIELKRF